MSESNSRGIEPTQPISVTLKAQEWNTVLAMLAEAPYKISAPLVMQITQQANGAAEAALIEH